MPVNDAKTCGRVFYDAECRFCVAGRRRWGGLFERRGFVWLRLQTPGTAARLGITEDQLRAEMWLQRADGRTFSGIGAWGELLRSVWWLWPLGMLIALPGVNALARALYRWIAHHRYCLGGRCRIHSHTQAGLHSLDVLLLAATVTFVVLAGRAWKAWIFMWALGITLGQFIKWLAWRDARSAGWETTAGRTLGWLFLWPGMDARSYFGHGSAEPTVIREWFAALLKLAVGVALIWFVGPRWLGDRPMALGWTGMVGIILCLHFGLFHLTSLTWRACGVNAPPIMKRPLAAVSLAQFWGERWNTGFSIPARRFLFAPLARRMGVGAASFAVFAVSGLMHDLVISVPARGGYGLPTCYFLLQGAGVWFERTQIGRTLGLGAGVRGWLFTFIVAAGPAFWLFHPPFVRNVILPMLHVLGVT